ncbi:esterase FE4-like [Ceratina calcarata]|uniref:Carboxylic ester hydrolase n=1 Tax=Ceratina calcarata TaxID=156304 RepID=A0AAJ7J2H2_9HYME|nr:esterase FE4-like [Ceratina calcarata]
MRLFSLLIYGFAVVCAQAEQDVQLEIPQGILKGLKTETVLHNKPYYSFRGIPYTKPNVGPNRFESPEPAEPWEGVYDATKYRPPCPFYCMIRKGLIGEEDCLYLNVYTPVLDKEAHKPVMLWIHPGGWNGGIADDTMFGPDFLVEDDVVVVTFSYRFGALGYLNTGDKSAPGNAGMKDQVMALKWLKDNIHYFGGSPSRVTIFGASSGAASALYHMVSPMSEGLFNSVILQSGTMLNPWAMTYNPREQAFMLGEALGIHTTDSAELVQKLTEFDVKDIITATTEITQKQNGLNGHMNVFVPSVEVDLGQDVFLSNDPWTLLKSGKIADVPVISGVNADECAFFAPLLIDAIEILNSEPEQFLPDDLNYTSADARKEAGQNLKKFYFGDKQVSKEDLNEYTKMLSDVYFNAGELLSLDIMKNRMSSPIYQYMFTFDSPTGFMKNLFGVRDGVAHGDELGYLFYSNAFKNLPEPGSNTAKMTNIFTKLWTNFAKDQNPTSHLDEDITVTWEPMGNENNYLNINQALKMEKNLMRDKHDYWKMIYKDIMP